MCALAQQLGDQRRLGLEVPARQRRAGAEARAVGHDQRPVRGQLELMAPRSLWTHHAAVDEHGRRAAAHAPDIQVLGGQGPACPRHQVIVPAARGCQARTHRERERGGPARVHGDDRDRGRGGERGDLREIEPAADHDHSHSEGENA